MLATDARCRSTPKINSYVADTLQRRAWRLSTDRHLLSGERKSNMSNWVIAILCILVFLFFQALLAFVVLSIINVNDIASYYEDIKAEKEAYREYDEKQ